MLDPRTAFYVQFPEDTCPRVLHPARVEAVDQGRHTAAADEGFVPIEVGLRVTVYYEHRRRFVKQPAVISAVVHGEAPGFVFELAGDPASAESRCCYRVSTVLTEMTCTLAGRAGCPLEDVSVTGFATVSPDEHAIGDAVEAELTDLNDRPFTGHAVVASVTPVDDGFRYGLSTPDPLHGGGTLQRGVSSLSLALQRRQLRRLSGAG